MSTQPCHNCDQLEGGSVVNISTPQQPFCEQCGDDANTCLEKIDTKCVYYHYNHPEIPTTLTNLGIPSNTDLQTILEKINGLVAQNLNVDLVVEDSATVNLTASGGSNHHLKADVLSSADAGNILQIRSTGLFVPNTSDGKVKVSATGASDYLVNQVVGGSDGVLSISASNQNNLLTLVPSVNVDNLAQLLCASDVFQSCITGGAVTNLTVTDSSSIDLTTSGAYNHTLSATVKVSANAGNQVSIAADGLYVPPSSAATVLTYDNGIHRYEDSIRLGGSLLESTSVTSTTKDMLFNTRTFSVGNGSAGYFDLSGVDTTNFVFAVNQTYTNLPVRGVTNAYLYSDVGINAGNTLITGSAVSSSVSSMKLSSSTNFTMNNANVVASAYNSVILNPSDATTLTFAAGTAGPRAASALGVTTILKSKNVPTTGTVTHSAGMVVYGPQQENTAGTYYPKVTNYYGVLVGSSREFLAIDNTVITNSYGIYQYGASDVNEFFGELRYHNGLTNASDARIKEELGEYKKGLQTIKQIRPIVYKYKKEYQPESNTYVGILAQEVENILPYAVKQGNNNGYTDFRYYDDKPLLYALVNAVKELSAQIDTLKAEVAALKA